MKDDEIITDFIGFTALLSHMQCIDELESAALSDIWLADSFDWCLPSSAHP